MSAPRHASKRPVDPRAMVLDGEALWCARCERYIPVAPVTGYLWFFFAHAHGLAVPRPWDDSENE